MFDLLMTSLTEILRNGRQWNKNNWRSRFLLKAYYLVYTLVLDRMGRTVKGEFFKKKKTQKTKINLALWNCRVLL